MRVFRTWGQSRMHPKVCSDTETSAEDATDTIQKANPTTSRLRLNIRLPFVRVDNGPELTAEAFVEWCTAQRIGIGYIQPGKPKASTPAYRQRPITLTSKAKSRR